MKTTEYITAENLNAEIAKEGYKIGHAEIVAPRAENVYHYEGLDGRFVELDITKIISIIADNVSMGDEDEAPDTIPFDIQQKIDYNELDKWNEIIHEYAYLKTDVDRIYQEYDRMGKNKSRAVLDWLRFQIYFQFNKKHKGDELFDQIANEVIRLVKNDSEYNVGMGLETMSVNVYIVLVHAFMKCKIFKKPPVC